MHRARMSLRYLEENGWKGVVLAVRPSDVEGVVEPALLRSIPADTMVERVPALPIRWTRRLGVGSLALRAMPYLYKAGAKIIADHRPDLVYFTTTQFATMTLGRLWKRRFGTPYVIDLQDPWAGGYHQSRPRGNRPPKYRWASALHRTLEPWTMRQVDGVVAVTEPYHRDLCRRYPSMRPDRCATVPFGVEPGDFEIAASSANGSQGSPQGERWIRGVYVGVLGNVMRTTCTAICEALAAGLRSHPELFSRVRLDFVGTDYAHANPRETIRPIAVERGLGAYIMESPRRVPYFESLKHMVGADFLLLVGSDDPHYTASKVFPYIFARRPLLAILHEASSTVEILRSTSSAEVVTFGDGADPEAIARSLLPRWERLLRRLPFEPATNGAALEDHTAREMTRRQCELFDRIVTER